ncbi:MAG TPA: hypothetical protein VKF59_17010 [Candidatus Dormibacteraeota bacterium]|nr:hypothetical protein [Candidatus Dormibacteraeota bacterium]
MSSGERAVFVEGLGSECAELGRQLIASEGELARALTRAARAEAERDRLAAELESTSSELERMRSSRSWRATRLLRVVGRRLLAR